MKLTEIRSITMSSESFRHFIRDRLEELKKGLPHGTYEVHHLVGKGYLNFSEQVAVFKKTFCDDTLTESTAVIFRLFHALVSRFVIVDHNSHSFLNETDNSKFVNSAETKLALPTRSGKVDHRIKKITLVVATRDNMTILSREMPFASTGVEAIDRCRNHILSVASSLTFLPRSEKGKILMRAKLDHVELVIIED